MLTIEKLTDALKTDRAGFIKGLIAAGDIDMVVYSATADNSEHIRLALNVLNDLDGTFNTQEFRSWVYALA